LGGKDAAIVCADADLDLASSGILWGSFVNAGQTCAAIERIYVVDSVADEFGEQLLGKLSRLRHGDDDADVGSLTFKKQLTIVKSQLKDAVEKGARVVAGGPEGVKNRNGSLWFPPTVVEGATAEMSLMQSETFGPIVPLLRVQDEEEAIRRANEDGFNLTASVWTRDSRRGATIASRLRAGAVAVNAHAETWGSPWAPWGGIGESGYGRVNGVVGLREFVHPVVIAKNLAPGLKRLWWYPYDDATTQAFRAGVGAVSAPDWRTKLQHVSDAMKNATQAIKDKI
jgi:acyl-CoA reductase-like NAD-dependent aldehyde dehydrogenase